MADRMTLSSAPVIKVSAPTNTWEVARQPLCCSRHSMPPSRIAKNKYEPETCRRTHLARQLQVFEESLLLPT